ncbi:uncharacterized protein LOC143000820 [Genypterus blacodes]|uniref:uncharacterized protein LOC143000820 n=1 Tax=Genypterus blacodes TaxID=154954 RepID=UPI003F75F34D
MMDKNVSTLTEPGALKKTSTRTRQESETNICTDNGDPTFRRNSKGALETEPSGEAQDYSAELTKQPSWKIRKPEVVQAEAKAPVQSEGGDCGNDRLVLSRFTIQFGNYKGKTFKWLLENDVGYTAQLVASHQKEKVDKNSQNPQMANKNALTDYSMFYPDFANEVRFHRQAPKGKIGFGKYKSETLKSLCESKDRARISYVEFLRGKKETCTPNSQMEGAIRYILQRDQKKPVAARRTRSAATRPPTSSAKVSFLEKNAEDLIQKVTKINVKQILDSLKTKKVIDQECYDAIFKIRTSQDQMREIFTVIKTQQGKIEFYGILEKKEPVLMDELKKRRNCHG